MKKITVIGAGFAGLTLSLRLAQKGFQVDLYEKSSRVGGLLRTEYTPHGMAEKAANGLLVTESVMQLFDELQVSKALPLQESSKRYIFRNHPSRWPLKIFESLGLLARMAPKMIFRKSALIPRPHETLQQWGLRNLGAAGTEWLLLPGMQGVYGDLTTDLSASLVLGPLFRRKRKGARKYKGLISCEKGMQELIDALHQKVVSLGVQVHLSSEADLSVNTPLVIATSLSAAQKMLPLRNSAVAAVFAKIATRPLISLTLFFKSAPTQYQGFGCLIPQNAGLQTLGVLMNSFIFPKRGSSHSETWILKDSPGVSDEHLLKTVAQERAQILEAHDELVDYRVSRWPEALPMYDLSLEKALEKLAQIPSDKKTYLHGNYLGGIGLSKILERSEELAEQIARDHA